ncbi:hypothetical protein JCM10450v2_003913 [Rhodotorula kratochvilovae]
MAADLPHATAPFIIFSDFDGTITTKDSNDTATDELGFGLARRRELNVEILNGQKSFRRMLASVWTAGYKFDAVKEFLVKNITLDTGFKACFDWCKANNVPLVIVSSGMKPIIEAILANLIGAEDAAKIDIIANDVEIAADGSWKIVYRHPESHFGHDKSRATAPYRDLPHKPTLFFCGDGVSDLSAAKAADLLFVKVIEGHTNDLAVHCDREKIPYVAFDNFEQVRDVVARVVEGKTTVEQELATGKQ